jgi:protein SCO1
MKRLLLAFTTVLVACSGNAPAHRTAEVLPPPAPAPVVEPTLPAELPPSIYDLQMQLIDSHGQSIGLDVARGKPVIIAMFYASCTVACPLLIAEVDQVIAELPAPARDDVQVLLVSFDAKRDTPAKLSALMQERKLDDAQWTLAAAGDADARALAAVLGVKYRQLANGDFAHGSTIVALDAEGHPIARTDVLGQRAPLVVAIQQSGF